MSPSGTYRATRPQTPVSDALVDALKMWGVRFVFGVSGANIESFHDALYRRGGTELRSIMTRREDAAAFMADARARVHRTLGVCCSTSGGAMFNLAVGIAEAYAESVPLLAIIGQTQTQLEGRGAFQDGSGIGRAMDARAFLATITKYVAKIEDPAAFHDQLRIAATTALSGRPGPVALLVPKNIWDADARVRPPDFPRTLGDMVASSAVDQAELSAAYEVIANAKRPVLVVGHGNRRSVDPGEVVRFAREREIPVATTMSARGEFPHEDPLYLGSLGVAGHPSVHEYINAEADVLVVVGAGLNVMTRAPIGELLSSKRVVAINVDPGEISRSVPSATLVRADASIALRALRGRFNGIPSTPTLNGYRRTQFVPRLAPIPNVGRHPQDDDDQLLQSEAIRVIDSYLDAFAHIVFDAGNCASAAMHLTRVPAGATSTIALGGGGMGYAFAAAVGAQLGSPAGTRTIALCGDGAFLINGLEIHTAVDQQQPTLFVVFNNQMHGMCATRQQLYFDSRFECVAYSPVDVASVVRGLGGPDALFAASVGSVRALSEALDCYMAGKPKPGVIELRLRREEMPPFTNFLMRDEPTAKA